jgi:hypothetical protein
MGRDQCSYRRRFRAPASPKPIMLCSQLSRSSGVDGLVSPAFVPEGKLDPVPESELVVDDAKVILDDVLGSSDFSCNFAVFESLSNEFDDTLFSFTGDSFTVAFASEHICLRYKSVASFTRLIPPLIPNLKKSRLK